MSGIIARKRKNVAVIVSSDDDSSGYNESCKNGEIEKKNKLSGCNEDVVKIEEDIDLQISKKQRRSFTKFQEDSSDDDVTKHPIASTSKIQTQRKNLEKLCQKKRNKSDFKRRRRQRLKSNEESDNEELNDEKHVRPSTAEEEEERLKNSKIKRKLFDCDMSSEDDTNFINDDEESAASHFSSETEEYSDSKSEENVNTYANPYMERNNEFERENIMEVLSKSTEKDKSNQKRYKKEIGKYQLQIHSENNPALYLSNRRRKNRIMRATRHDKGLNEERNIDIGDDEYHHNRAISLMGSLVHVIPYIKTVAKYPGRCGLPACNEKFEPGQTEIVRIKEHSEIELQSRIKANKNSYKKSLHWICASHCPPGALDEDGSSSSQSSCQGEDSTTSQGKDE